MIIKGIATMKNETNQNQQKQGGNLGLKQRNYKVPRW